MGETEYVTDCKLALQGFVRDNEAAEPAAQLQDIFFHLDSGDLCFVTFENEVATEVFVWTGDIALVRSALDLDDRRAAG